MVVCLENILQDTTFVTKAFPSCCCIYTIQITRMLTTTTIKHLHMKYFVSGVVLLKHCKAEFIKHVFPRLFKPHKPRDDMDFWR